jgi:predicted CXXCH cytochrome family protein
MEGDGHYVHFRLPLVPGKNNFTLTPSGQRFEINFQKIQADLTMKGLAKDAYLFHQGESLPDSCVDCHALLDTEIIVPVGIEKQNGCAVCHKNLTAIGTNKHGPMINLECLSCHQQSGNPLRVGFPTVSTKELCLLCHPGKKAWLARKSTHGPLLLGGCTLCHNPHGENHRYQLWAEGSLTLCISCHSDKAKLVSEKAPIPFVHGIITGNGCVACHDPHAADQDFVLRKPINELCVSCHPSLKGVTTGHPVARHPVAAEIDYLRPGRQLVCTSCHEPHGTSHQYFLIETKLGGRLCRGCHKR